MGVTRYKQLYVDKCIPQGDKTACVTCLFFMLLLLLLLSLFCYPATRAATNRLRRIFVVVVVVADIIIIINIIIIIIIIIIVILLPRYMGSHKPSWEDLCPFLEGGGCDARSLSCLKIVST